MPDAGSVWVDIIPDTKKFGPTLKAELGTFAKLNKVEIPVDVDAAKAKAELRSIGPEITKLNNRRASIRVNAAVSEALAKLRSVKLAADRLDGRVVRIFVDSDGDTRTLLSALSKSSARSSDGGGGAPRLRRPIEQVGSARPFTDMSPAAIAAAWTLVPPVAPAVGALAGGLGAVAAGFGAAAAGAGAFAMAAIPVLKEAGEATDDLTRGQERYRVSLMGLSSEWQSFQDATDGPVLQAAAEWVDTATVGLRRVAPVAAVTAGALSTLAREARQALNTDEWRQFFSFLERQASPSTRVFGRSLGNLALGLAGMLRQMEPLWNVVGPNLERLSADFAEWGNSTGNFTGFVQFMIQDGPKFVSLFSALFDAGIQLGVAIAPLGTVYAEGLTYLARALAAVAENAPFLVQLAVAVGTARIAFQLFQRVQATMVQPLQDAGARVKEFAANLGGVGKQAGVAARGTSAFRGAVSSAVGALGGPWGLAIAGAVTALGIWISSLEEARQAAESYYQAIRQDSGVLGDNTRELLANRLAQEGAVEAARELGIPMSQVTDALLGNSAAYDELNKKLSEYQTYARASNLDEQIRAEYARVLQDALEGNNEAISEGVQQLRDNEEALSALGLETEAFVRQQGTLNGSLAEGVYQASQFKAALDRLVEGNLSAAQAEINYEQAVDRATEAVAKNGATLDTNTEAGQNNKQALVDLARAANDQLSTMEDNKASAEDLTSTYEEQRAEFVKIAKQMGYTGDAAEDLADDFLKIPGRRNTTIVVTANGVYSITNDNIWSSRAALGDPNFETPGYGRMATGGPVVGPGTGTSDSIPTLLSHGEHVWTAKEVEMAGGHRGVYALRQAVRMGVFGEPVRRARGGPVGAEIDLFGPADVINDHREDVRISLQKMIVGLHDKIAGEVAKQIRKEIASGVPVVQAATRWLGTPYSWGGGGLTGPSRGFGPGARTVGFDCSSLVQHAWWQGARVLLPRTTYDQISTGVAVPKGRHAPGDLVFPHRGHVAMVVGRDRLIHAPRTGVPVSYRSMYANPIAIRRPKRRASGGPLGSGDWSWVGEEGPELVHVSNPAHVFSARESARLVSDAARVVAAQPAGAMTAPLVGEYHSHIHDGDTSVREAMQEFDHYLRVLRRGGVHAAP